MGEDEKAEGESKRDPERMGEGDTYTHPTENQRELKERWWTRRRERSPEKARKTCVGRGVLRGRIQRKKEKPRE